MRKEYYGITHALPLWLLGVWKAIMCKKNCHVFEEVVNSDGEHYFVCDACQLIVVIQSIDTSFIGMDE